MEENILDNDSYNQDSFGITNEGLSFLREAGKWCKFLSILGFIIVGFMSVFGLIGLVTGIAALSGPGEILALLITVAMILAIYVLPTWHAYQFSKEIKLAVEYKDKRALNMAFSNLKSLFKTIGILTLVIISLYILMIVFGVLMGNWLTDLYL